jgi:uncharacterized protein (TIGR03435 family)
MPDANDMDLVREFARNHSEAAFTELVRRHLNLVYSVARRCTGSDSDAQDVTQAVFVILARKAAGLRTRTVLTGWLYETTRYTAACLQRTNTRRHAREQEAYMQSTLTAADTADAWSRLAPHLEAAMAQLGERDRTLLALRFYENKSGPEAAALLGIREAAAHKRTARAVEKLRIFFTRRGVALSAAAIAGAVSANSVQVAPAALAKTISAVAMAKGMSAGASTLTLVKGALKIMAWTKMKTAVVVGVGVLLTAGTTTVTIKEMQEHRTYPWEAGGPEGSFSGILLDRQPPQVRILSCTFTNFAEGSFGDKMMGTGISAQGVVAVAYGTTSARTIPSTALPGGKYDYIASLARGNAEALQHEVRRKFGVAGKIETRETDVLLLKVMTPDTPGLKRSVNLKRDDILAMQIEGLRFQNRPLADLAGQLEALANIPVLDWTGLTNRYDFNLHLNWDLTPNWWKLDPNLKQPLVNLDNVKQALVDQLGLELVPSHESIKMLIVEKVK